MLCKIIYKNFITARQDRQILSDLYDKIILKQKSKSFGNARSSQKWLLFYPDICNAGCDGLQDILIIEGKVFENENNRKICGSNINYPAGTDFQVEVRDNVDLGVTPEELKDAMNPNIPHGQEIVIEVK